MNTISADDWRRSFAMARKTTNSVAEQIHAALKPTVVLSSSLLGVEILGVRNQKGDTAYCHRTKAGTIGPFTSASEAALDSLLYV